MQKPRSLSSPQHLSRQQARSRAALSRAAAKYDLKTDDGRLGYLNDAVVILAGLIHDYTGMIKIGGKPVGISSKASLAYLPDRTYFPERFRTIDCIDYFADFFKDFDKMQVGDVMECFDLVEVPRE